MKRILSVMLVLFALCGSASAAGGLFDECIPDYQGLILDAAITKAEDMTFFASVDGKEMVEIEASPFPADSIGHIIVVDLAWGWTSYVDEGTVIRPILNDYLNRLDRANLVKFIIATPNGISDSQQYMSVEQASAYVNNSLSLPEKNLGKPMSTGIATALQLAYKEAATLDAAGPAFKSVFALVDPANPSIADSATYIRNEYKKTGNSFPVTIVTVYVTTYMENYTGTETSKRVRSGLDFYDKLASANGTLLVRLNHRRGEVISTDGITAAFSPRKYFRMNLTPLHPLIDYARDEHEIVIEGRTRRGSAWQTEFSNIKTRMLPKPAYTPVPEITPDPIVTPEPPVVGFNDNNVEAKRAIIRLQQLYYLDADKTFKGFEEECQFAFLHFCHINGIEEQDVILSYAYDLLMSDKAVPCPTATPTAAPTTPEPPVEPTPAPYIYSGISSTPASRLIDILKRLYYLDSDAHYNEWNSECMLALIEMCEASGIDLDQELESVDQELYNWIISSTTLVPKETVTPVPDPTVPPEGYRLGDMDTDDSSFIAQMQTILQALNLYTSEKVVGQLDQATMDAVILYCQQYGMAMNSSFRIDKSIVTEILTNGGNRTPYMVPAPSFSEQFAAFLQKDALFLGSFQVKMWMLIALALVLVFIIVLICIFSHHKTEEHSISLPHVSTAQQVTPGIASSSLEDVTIPLDGRRSMEDDVTVPLGSGMNVTLTISGGPSQGVVHALIGSKNYIIGRETSHGGECDLPLAGDHSVSRKHAALNYHNGQLFIHNLSMNGTSVNGHSLDVNQRAANSEMTVPLNAVGQQNSSAFPLKRGDVIEICRYRIKIDW